MLDTREIHSLTDFLRNHKAHVTRLKETHAPEVLTVNGKAEVVVQDAASYQANARPPAPHGNHCGNSGGNGERGTRRTETRRSGA